MTMAVPGSPHSSLPLPQALLNDDHELHTVDVRSSGPRLRSTRLVADGSGVAMAHSRRSSPLPLLLLLLFHAAWSTRLRSIVMVVEKAPSQLLRHRALGLRAVYTQCNSSILQACREQHWIRPWRPSIMQMRGVSLLASITVGSLFPSSSTALVLFTCPMLPLPLRSTVACARGYGDGLPQGRGMARPMCGAEAQGDPHRAMRSLVRPWSRLEKGIGSYMESQGHFIQEN